MSWIHAVREEVADAIDESGHRANRGRDAILFVPVDHPCEVVIERLLCQPGLTFEDIIGGDDVDIIRCDGKLVLGLTFVYKGVAPIFIAVELRCGI